jgi:hypothetical protein
MIRFTVLGDAQHDLSLLHEKPLEEDEREWREQFHLPGRKIGEGEVGDCLFSSRRVSEAREHIGDNKNLLRVISGDTSWIVLVSWKMNVKKLES